MHARSLYSLLALVGAAPFVGAAVAAVLGLDPSGPLGSPANIALSYGLAIASFLAGVHWATRLYKGAEVPAGLFVTSNAVVLGCWIPYLLASTAMALIAQLLAFGVLLFIDYRLLRASVIDAHYFRTRAVASGLAGSSLLAILVSLRS